jgi:hypothetical protein
MKFEKVNSATGAASPGYSRNNSASVLVNHHTGTMNDGKLINKGRGPTVGNKSDDNSMYPDAAVVPKLPAQGSVRDNINRGPQVRYSGGGRFPETRAWDPKCGQNYKGDADSINMGRGPTKGNQR